MLNIQPLLVSRNNAATDMSLMLLFLRERPGSAPAQSQWVGQILQGAVNIGQSRMVTAGDLEDRQIVFRRAADRLLEHVQKPA